MKRFIAVMLSIAGVIHLLPLAGVMGADKLSTLYGLRFDDHNLVILMRHRAVLFGLLGALLFWAAWRPLLQPSALVAGLISVLSFLWLAVSAQGYNTAIAGIVAADCVALACLLAACLAHGLKLRAGT